MDIPFMIARMRAEHAGIPDNLEWFLADAYNDVANLQERHITKFMVSRAGEISLIEPKSEGKT